MWKRRKQDDYNNDDPDEESHQQFGESQTDDTSGDCGASHICVGYGGSLPGYCILRKTHRVHFCGQCNNNFLD